jgi:hypothetical protein
LDNLRYKHHIGKQGIGLISLSGPERSEFYTKSANVVQEGASSLPGTDEPLSYIGGARRVVAELGIVIDTNTYSQRIKSNIVNRRVQALHSLLPIIVALSAPGDADPDARVAK